MNMNPIDIFKSADQMAYLEMVAEWYGISPSEVSEHEIESYEREVGAEIFSN